MKPPSGFLALLKDWLDRDARDDADASFLYHVVKGRVAQAKSRLAFAHRRAILLKNFDGAR